MRVACLSMYGNFSPIMERIGNEIGAKNALTIYYYRDYRKWWDGLLTKATDMTYLRGVSQNANDLIWKFRPDYIIFDMSGEGELADRYITNNWAVIGGSEFCDFLELNRWYGSSVLKAIGLSMPAAVEVKDYKAAKDFLKSRKVIRERWVIKFNDNQGNFSSYVSEDVPDMLEELEHFMDSNRVNFKSGAVLQEFVEGIELSCEGWFNGREFLPDSFNYTMEEKKFLTGSLGPSTGCEGNLVFRANSSDLLPRQILKLTPLLRKYGYVGPFDLNNMICTKPHQYDGFPPLKKGANYILEPTPRFGYDAIYTLLEGYKGRISDLFYGLSRRTLRDINIIDQPLMGVRLSIPPYPYNDISQTEDKGMESLAKKTMKYMEKSVEGTITRLKDPRLLRSVWFQDIRWDEKYKRLVVNGTDSVIAVCTASKPTLREAILECYRVVKAVDVPNAQYRLDIGKRAFKEIPQLAALKVIETPSWWTEDDPVSSDEVMEIEEKKRKESGEGLEQSMSDPSLGSLDSERAS